MTINTGIDLDVLNKLFEEAVERKDSEAVIMYMRIIDGIGRAQHWPDPPAKRPDPPKTSPQRRIRLDEE